MGRNVYNIGVNDMGRMAQIKAQNGTIKELIDILNNKHSALMIRPTGFGKTFCMMKLCRDMEGCNKVLYMYPTDVISQSINEEFIYPKYKVERDENGKEVGIIQLTTSINTYNSLKGKIPYIELCSYTKMLRDWHNKNIFAKGIDLSGKSDSEIHQLQENWILNKLKEFDLLILDEAHRVGAQGFMEYWPSINKIVANGYGKSGTLSVLGATATPMRTDGKLDIEKEVFCFHNRRKRLESVRAKEIGFPLCWNHKILSRPLYTKCVLNKDEQSEYILNKLEETMIGPKSEYYRRTHIGYNSKYSNSVKITNSFNIKALQKYKNERIKILELLGKIRQPHLVVRDALEEIDKIDIIPRFKYGKYARYIIFYSNTTEMLKNSERLNRLISDAYEIGKGKYKKLNKYYLASNMKLIDEFNAMSDVKITGNTISDIKYRDEEIRLKDDNTEKSGDEYYYSVIDKYTDGAIGEVDIIHCIDILNMGYHVGHVSGVIVNRKTASEIKYYQQLGRCMSTQADHTPLIIDLVDADAELFEATKDTIRVEAAEKIKEFIQDCIVSKDYELNQNLFDRVRANLNFGCMSDKMIEELYFEKNAPIYFIYAVGKSLGYDMKVEDLVNRINNMCKARGIGIEPDDFCLYANDLNKKLFDMGDTRLGLIAKTNKLITSIKLDESEDETNA